MTPQQLKNSILQFAIQGKLVEQRADEGTAEELYQQIQEEKQKLIKEGKIKKEKPLPEITEDEIPFDIPESWKWVKFENIVSYNLGKTPPTADSEMWTDDYNWVSISDIQQGQYIYTTKRKVSNKAFVTVFNSNLVKKETLIMSFKLTVGSVAILGVDALHNEAIISINPIVDKEYVTRDYLAKILPLIVSFGKTKNAIKGKTLNSKSISNLPIPLPPLAEQKRIVAKIEELMNLVDEYKDSYEQLVELNKKFPSDIQKSILQYAIQGKLVEQRADEGTAEELYQQIQEEKQKLIKEGKIKKEKPLPEITEDEIPFEIPKSWKWVRIGELANYKKGPFGSALTKSIFVSKSDNAVKVYEQKNAIQKNSSLGENYITKDYFEDKMSSFEVFPGDIIVSCAGTIGELYRLPSNIEKGIINQALMRVRLYEPIYCEFYELLFDYLIKDYSRKSSKGSAIKNIPPFDILKNYIIPLPPLAEQKRIVAKIEELMALSNQLKQ